MKHKIIDEEAAYLFGSLTRQILIAAILIGFGYFAGKVAVYEQQAGVHKVVKGDSALPDLYPEGKELR